MWQFSGKMLACFWATLSVVLSGFFARLSGGWQRLPGCCERRNNIWDRCPGVMDQITIKTPNPKCRLFWRLIEFIEWRCSQSYWYFRPLLWTSAPLTFSLVDPPPPRVNEYRGMFYPCLTGGGGWDQVVWRASTGVIHCVFDQLLYYQKQKSLEGRGPQTDKQLPPNPFIDKFLRKKRPLGFGVFIVIWSMPGVIGRLSNRLLSSGWMLLFDFDRRLRLRTRLFTPSPR